MLVAINETRINTGVPPFVSSSPLAIAAQQHAEDLARRGVLSHSSEDGSMPWDRAMAAGYPSDQVYEVIGTTDGTARDVLKGWQNSPRHWAILSDPTLTVIGVGVAEGGGRRWYVADLGRAP